MSLLIVASALLGLLFGSFANVCVHRIPKRQSLAFPASHCPICSQPVAVRDNIPLISWLLLGGKCRHCGAAIAWRYPLLELLMGLTWAGLAWHFGPSPLLLAGMCLSFLLWVLTFIDLEEGILPNVLTFPGMALGIGFSVWLGYWPAAVIGMLAGYWIFWLVARLFLLITGREGMGYGDFKLLAMLGAFMGWQALPFIILASSVIGVVAGSTFLLLANRGLKAEIPFGPYLALAGMLWFVWGSDFLGWYAARIGA